MEKVFSVEHENIFLAKSYITYGYMSKPSNYNCLRVQLKLFNFIAHFLRFSLSFALWYSSSRAFTFLVKINMSKEKNKCTQASSITFEIFTDDIKVKIEENKKLIQHKSTGDRL